MPLRAKKGQQSKAKAKKAAAVKRVQSHAKPPAKQHSKGRNAKPIEEEEPLELEDEEKDENAEGEEEEDEEEEEEEGWNDSGVDDADEIGRGDEEDDERQPKKRKFTCLCIKCHKTPEALRKRDTAEGGEFVLLDTLIHLAEVAEAIVPTRIAKCSLPELQRHIEELESEGFDLPPGSAGIVTSKIATAHLQEQKFDAWLTCIAFWRPTDRNDCWSFVMARLNLLIPDGDEPEEENLGLGHVRIIEDGDERVQKDDKNVVVAKLRGCFFDSFFNDTVLGFAQSISQDSGPMVELAERICKEADNITKFAAQCLEYVEPLASACTSLLQTCRGICALLVPRPAVFDSTTGDVDFLFGISGGGRRRQHKMSSASVLADLCPQSRPLAQVMKLEDGAWRKMLDKYKAGLALEVAKKDAFYEVEKATDMLHNGGYMQEDGFENSEARVAAINDACARLPDLRNSLRPGACYRIEQNLLDEFTQQWEDWQKLDKDALLKGSQSLSAIVDVLGERGLALKAKIANHMQAIIDADKIQKLDGALTSLKFDKISDINDFVCVLEPHIGKDLSAQHLNLIGDVRDLVWQLLAKILEQEDSVKDINAISECLRVVKKFVGPVRIEASGPDVQDIPVTVAKAISDLKAAHMNLNNAVFFGGDVDLALNHAVRATEHYEKKVAPKYATEDNGLGGPCGIAVGKMLSVGGSALEKVKDTLADQCLKALRRQKDDYTSLVESVQDMAGGHPEKGGKVWHGGLAPLAPLEKVLAHCKTTLLKAKGSAIASGISKLDQATANLTSNMAKYKPFMPNFSDSFFHDAKTAGDKVIARAKTTKFEALLLKAWVDANGKRNLMFAATEKYLPGAGDVSPCCQPRVWAAVQELMGTT